MSLFVLHHAADFGVRPAWAAGVRQRLSTRSRETLERIFSFSTVPLSWISRLTEPQDGLTLLGAVADLQPARRLPTLTLPGKLSPEARLLLEEIAGRGSWNVEDRTRLLSLYGPGPTPSPAGFDTLLHAWTDLRAYGERYLDALQEYYLVYFSDEEARIGPAIEDEFGRARRLAETLSLAQLVERLSHGVRLQDIEQLTGVVLLPSWWVSPLVFLERAGTEAFIAFGARPQIQGGADGSEAPDGLVAAFKSLGDPTRLRILYYLSSGPLSPSELARRLRLRPPTIIHHLQALRLAGLVQITVGAGFERRYEVRPEALQAIYHSLQDYLNLHV
jgi:DNA-binding transcriptional ArsR family regulator